MITKVESDREGEQRERPWRLVPVARKMKELAILGFGN